MAVVGLAGGGRGMSLCKTPMGRTDVHTSDEGPRMPKPTVAGKRPTAGGFIRDAEIRKKERKQGYGWGVGGGQI